MRFRPAAAAFAFTLLASCAFEEKGNDPGPAPAADHQEQVGAKMFEILQRRSPHGTPTNLRFTAPALDKVAAANLKRFVGQDSGAHRLWTEGLARHEGITGAYMGVDVDAFHRDVKDYFEGRRDKPALISLQD